MNMTAREQEIHDATVDLLLDKGTLDRVDMNDIKSFATLLYQSERFEGIDSARHSNLKTNAHLLALEFLNLREDEVEQIQDNG